MRLPNYERAIRADRLVPSSQDYATVGHLYRGIRAGVVSLSECLGEKLLFAGSPSAQIDASVAPLPGLIAVSDAKRGRLSDESLRALQRVRRVAVRTQGDGG